MSDDSKPMTEVTNAPCASDLDAVKAELANIRDHIELAQRRAADLTADDFPSHVNAELRRSMAVGTLEELKATLARAEAAVTP